MKQTILIMIMFGVLVVTSYVITRPPEPPPPVWWSVQRIQIEPVEPVVINNALWAREGWEPFAIEGKYLWIKRKVK